MSTAIRPSVGSLNRRAGGVAARLHCGSTGRNNRFRKVVAAAGSWRAASTKEMRCRVDKTGLHHLFGAASWRRSSMIVTIIIVRLSAPFNEHPMAHSDGIQWHTSNHSMASFNGIIQWHHPIIQWHPMAHIQSFNEHPMAHSAAQFLCCAQLLHLLLLPHPPPPPPPPRLRPPPRLPPFCLLPSQRPPWPPTCLSGARPALLPCGLCWPQLGASCSPALCES